MKLIRYYYFLRNYLLNIPIEINMQYSDRCNLKCLQCNVWKIRNLPNLTLKQKIHILKKLKNELGYFTITLSGGEILLDKTIFDFLSFCKENSILVNIVTNSTIIDDRIAKNISRYSNLRLIISLDGPNAKTHDYLRGINGTYKKVIYAIKMLHKHKFTKISINTVVSGINYRELTNIIQLCIKNNIKKISFVPVILNNYDNYKSNMLWPKDINSFNNEIDKLFLIDRNLIEINENSELIRIKKYFNNPYDETEKCMNNPNLIRIDRYGNIYMCNKKKEIYGNIIKEDLAKILRSESRKKFIKNMDKCNLPCKFFICSRKKNILNYLNKITKRSS